MEIRFLLFTSVFTLLLSLATFYISRRAIARSPWAANHRKIVWSLGLLFIALQALGPILYRVYPNHLNEYFIIEWFGYTTLGLLAFMFFYVAFADLVLVFWRRISRSEDIIDVERRSFMSVGALTVTSAAVGLGQTIHGPEIYEVEIPIANLPKDFHGFRIVQISDLHVGPTIGRKYVEKVVTRANALNADLVVLTGDFVDGFVDQLKGEIELLSQIKSTHGMFFTTGNHEYFWGVKEWMEFFKNIGARVLLNEHAVITRGASQLVLAGVPDESGHRFFDDHRLDINKALLGSPSETVKILLAHQPTCYAEAAANGIHLQLSGHTHGGQFFPWNLIVASVYRYYKGLNRHENTWVYVNRGTGYWGPPIRFGIPAEISLIKLVPA